MRRRVCPQKRHTLEIPGAIDRPERRAEGPSVAEGRRHLGDVGIGAVEAAGEAAVKVEVRGAEEPMAGGDDQMKAVYFERPGGPDVLRVKQVPKPTVYIHELMIKVVATGVNSYDALFRRGAVLPRYAFDAYPGNECSGIVVAVGSEISDFKEGDEVCAILESGGGYAEFVVVPALHVVKIPSGVSLLVAATLPVASCLSLYALSFLTKVTPGKIILIHGAAGGNGIIALQYAKHLGCQVFAVAETEENLRLCKMLGAEVCINYKKEDFCKRVKAETRGQGVDIVLDISESDNFQENLNCLAFGGSLVILGPKGNEINVNIDISVLGMKDIKVIGADLLNLCFMSLKKLLSDAVGIFWPLIEAGNIRPIIGKVFSFFEVAEAHRALEECRVAGKLLLVPMETAPAQSDDICSYILFLVTKYFKS